MSITLPTALQSSLTIGGVAKETDNFAAVTSMTVDWLGKTLTFIIQQGTTVGQVFTPGQYPPNYEVILSLTTGVWTISGSALTGVITGAPAAAVLANLLATRNVLEAFVVATTLFGAATDVNWTS